jgi:hypothetical protein
MLTVSYDLDKPSRKPKKAKYDHSTAYRRKQQAKNNSEPSEPPIPEGAEPEVTGSGDRELPNDFAEILCSLHDFKMRHKDADDGPNSVIAGRVEERNQNDVGSEAMQVDSPVNVAPIFVEAH